MHLTQLVVLLFAQLQPPASTDAERGAWIADLKSGDAGAWHVAQIQLARAGKASLVQMESLAGEADSETRKRLMGTVDMMLLTSTKPNELAEQKLLSKLCAPRIKEARDIIKVLFKAEKYDSGDHGVQNPYAPSDVSSDRKAIMRAVKLGGVAVPAAIELCHGENAASRMYGVDILKWIQASGQIQTLESLMDDKGKITVSHGCSVADSTVGNEVSNFLNSTSMNGWFQRRHRPNDKLSVRDEARLFVEALNREPRSVCTLPSRVQTELGPQYEGTWEECWVRVQPTIKQYFEMPIEKAKR